MNYFTKSFTTGAAPGIVYLIGSGIFNGYEKILTLTLFWLKDKFADMYLFILLDFTSVTGFAAKTNLSKSGEPAVIKRPLLSFTIVQTDNPLSL